MMSRHDDLRDMAKLAGVDRDPNLMALVDSPILPDDKRAKLAKYLRSLVAQNCPRPHAFLPAPTRQEAQAGTVPLGRVITGRGPEYTYRLRAEEAASGSLICGPTGAGKSLLLAQLALEFHRNRHAVWVFDTEGDLTALLVHAAPDILVVDYRQFRQEIFEPDPRMELDWIEFISKVFASWTDPLMAGDGMRCMSREVIIALRDRNAPLTPHQFLEELLRRRHRLSMREGNFLDSLRNRFEGMIVPLLGQTYAGGHHDLLAMLRQSLVWRLQGLSFDALSFFATQLLHAVSLLQHPRPGGRLENLQFIDEFARFQSSDFRTRLGAGESFLVDYIRTARKRRLGLMLGSQTPQLLPKAVLSDMNTMISFRPIDGSFLDCVSHSMNLSGEQEAELMELSDREPRQAVLRCPGVTGPFLLELPKQSPTWATPEEIAQRIEQTKAWLDGIYQSPARPRPSATSDESSPAPLFTPRDHPLSKALLDYLVVCAQDWSVSVTARDKRHDVSPGLGNRYRKQLIDEGLIRAHRILTGQRGGQLQVTELTEQGRSVLDRFQVQAPQPPSRGGFEHRLWQQIVHSWAVARGYPAQIEQEVAGKPVDVGVVWDERRVAVEIMVEGIEKELDNLGKDLDRGWDQVVFCAVSQETLDSLRERVRETFGEDPLSQGRVSFRRLYEFLQANGPDTQGEGGPRAGNDAG